MLFSSLILAITAELIFLPSMYILIVAPLPLVLVAAAAVAPGGVTPCLIIALLVT